MRYFVNIVVVIGSLNLSSQSITDFDFLIGSWDTREVVFEGTPRAYIEAGTRVCEYILDSTYIKCESRTVRQGRDRVSNFLFNYDKSEGHYRLLKIYSDYDHCGMKSWKLDLENNRITESDITGEQYVGEIAIVSKDKLVWRGWWPKMDEDPKLELIFVEEITRQTGEGK